MSLLDDIIDPERVIYMNGRGQMLGVFVNDEQQAIDDGLYKLSPEDLAGVSQHEIEKEEYGGVGGQVVAGLTGAARGLTLGASDWLLQHTGKAFGMSAERSREILEKTREYNPATAIAAEITGAIAPAVLTLGESVPGTAASLGSKAAQTAARWSAPGMAARAGVATEKLVAGVAGRIAKNTSATITKAVFDKSLARGIGGVVEGGLYGAGHAISREALDNQAGINVDALIHDVGAGAIWGGGLGAALGIGGSIGSEVSTAVRQSETAQGIAKLAQEAGGGLPGLLRQAAVKIQKMKVGDQFSKNQLLNALSSGVTKKRGAGSVTTYTTEEIGDALYGAGQWVGDTVKVNLVDKITRSPGIITKAEHSKLYNLFSEGLREQAKTLDDMITNAEKGSMDAIGLGAWSPEWKAAYENLKSEFGGEKLGKVKGYLNDIYRGGDATIKQRKAIDEFISVSNSAVDEISKVVSGPDPKLFQAQLKIQAKQQNALRDIIYQSSFFKLAKTKGWTGMDFAPMAAGMALDTIAPGLGIGGAALSSAMILGKNPRMEAMILQHGTEITRNLVAKTIPDTVKGLIKFSAKGVVAGTKIAKPIASGALGRPGLVGSAAIRTQGAFNKEGWRADIKQEKKESPHATWNRQLDLLVENPMALHDKLAASTQMLNQVLPRTAELMLLKSKEIAQFLQERKVDIMPIDNLSPYSKRQPGQAELRKFERFVSYAMNPATVFKEMKSGLVTTEGVETLFKLYPEMYKHLTLELLEHLGDPKTKLTTQGRAKIAKILGVTEGSIVHSQMVYQQQPDQQEDGKQPPGRPRKQSETAKKGMFKSELTRAQEISQKS